VTNSPHPRGRRPGKPDTRAKILDVARQRFLEGGSGAFTLRSIADEAGVNVALVSYYFGAKEGLLSAVLAPVVNPSRVLDRLARGDPATFAERALRTLLSLWESPETGASLRALIAGAVREAALAERVKETMEQEVIDKIAVWVGGHDARVRAAAFYAQLAGLIGTRYILRLEPIASMSPDELVRIYSNPLRVCLGAAHQNPVCGRGRLGE
jgi:AcrR family transcriptional regulator